MKIQFIVPQQVNTVGMFAHYKLWDGLMTTSKVFDYALNSHDGTLQDTDAPSAPTLIPTWPSFNFDGSNDYINIPDADIFTPALTPFSISAWVYMHDATNFVVASKGVFNTDGEWRFQTSGSDILLIRFHDESVADCYIGRLHTTALTTYENQWIHLVMTSDGGTLSSGSRLYLNRERVDNANSQLNPGSFVTVENLAHDIWIGNYNNVNYANGQIDDVRFFNKELSAVEVKNIYEQTRGRYSV